jgi:hypothetical protein
MIETASDAAVFGLAIFAGALILWAIAARAFEKLFG